jgi:hypothetical protein
MDYLYHYYERERGPFKNLSDLPIKDAQVILDNLKKDNTTLAAQRYDGYLERRRELENSVRNIFISKGGKPIRIAPHYMTLGECNWIKTWYNDGTHIKIPITEFDLETVSFTYGDMFPNFSDRVNDNNEYRRNAYMYSEMLDIVNKYGYPKGISKTGQPFPFRYIEAQIWSDDVINKYVSNIITR